MKNAKDLSKEEALERVKLYGSMGDARQYFDIEKLKRNYESRQQQLTQHRVQQDIYYKQGLEEGLPHLSYEVQIRQRELSDRQMRTRLLKETKVIYGKGHNLSKWLNKEANKGKVLLKSHPVKGKAKQKGKIPYKSLHKYFNTPVLSKQFNKEKTRDKER